MNAPDNDSSNAARDAAILATIDRVLTQTKSTGHDDPHSFAGTCSLLAQTAPKADLTFQTELGQRLALEIAHRKPRAHAFIRVRSLIPDRPHFFRADRPARLRFASLLLALTF